jgi:hypothetical protein
MRKEVRLTSAQPCHVRITSPTGGEITLEGLTESPSTEHKLSVFVHETGGKSLATEMRLEVEFSNGASSPQRSTIRFPIHRLPYTKE